VFIRGIKVFEAGMRKVGHPKILIPFTIDNMALWNISSDSL